MRYARYTRLLPPALEVELPARFTAVKFYFNDCFRCTPENRAFVERTIRELMADGPVISLSSGIAVDDHAPCEPSAVDDGSAYRASSPAPGAFKHLLTPQTNLLVQSAIVARAQRFVGTYGGFAYLAPLYGVESVGYYAERQGFAVRHLDLARTLFAGGGMGTLEARDLRS
jgi:hypothetical protein